MMFLPMLVVVLLIESTRAVFWCCFFSCCNRDKIFKCRNVKGFAKGQYQIQEGYPSEPPFPSPYETVKILNENPDSLGLALTTIEEDLSCADSCAICFFGYNLDF